VLFLDFDWLGSLIFLWFIFKGLKNSKDAKRKHEQRRGQVNAPKREIKPKSSLPTKGKPIQEPVQEPVQEPQQEPAPAWFPFELPKLDNRQKESTRSLPKKDETIKPKELVKKAPQVHSPSKKVAIIKEQGQIWERDSFDLDQKAVVNGIIWSEILGPPRAKNKYPR